MALPPLPFPREERGEGAPALDDAKRGDAVFNFPFNISGLPAISLPLGQSAGGVPIGMQLVGRYGDEATVLALSTQLEEQMPWKDRRPAI
ncbi:amidase family protein [Mesorhizobium sp. WSM3860]|uniref:amidase family protein n=1 Tax=Mesorhizobium sp. WSM3860 TaxID=2029403 RepID=UPI001140E4C7|nr:amidase family protein [Mesorhizobium sp. WSM3860]